jgi:hypothetical protein
MKEKWALRDKLLKEKYALENEVARLRQTRRP